MSYESKGAILGGRLGTIGACKENGISNKGQGSWPVTCKSHQTAHKSTEPNVWLLDFL